MRLWRIILAGYFLLLAAQPVVSLWELYVITGEPGVVTCCTPDTVPEEENKDSDCCRDGWRCNPMQQCMKCSGFIVATNVKATTNMLQVAAEHPLRHSFMGLLYTTDIWHPPKA